MGARIAIVGTSIAARRRTASLCICSRRASRMSLLNASSPPPRSTPRSTPAASSWYVRAALGSGVSSAARRNASASPSPRPREDVGQFFDDGAPAPGDDPLHGLHRARAGPHLHGEEMVHRVELEPDAGRAGRDRALEAGARSARAVDEAGQTADQHDQRRLQRHRGCESRRGREQRRVRKLVHAIALRREIVHRRLPQQTCEVLVAARFERAAQPRRRGANRRTEQTPSMASRAPGDSKVELGSGG